MTDEVRWGASGGEAGTGAPDGEVEIQLGHLCSNRCVFCVSGELNERRMADTVPLEHVLEALEQSAEAGARRVVLLGGEPTIQATFLDVLDAAVRFGFEDIVVFTNGARIRSRPFLERVAASGRVRWRVSVQGANAAIHDRVTGRLGSFDRLTAGLENLRELGQDVTANMCLNRLNLEGLTDLPELLLRHGVRQLHVDMVRPADAGERSDEHLRTIMPRYSELAPPLRSMVARFQEIAPEIELDIGNYPYCFLPDLARRIHHGGRQTVTFDADGARELSPGRDKYSKQRADSRLVAACRHCVFARLCRGIPDRYLALYGGGEVTPVSSEELQGLGDEDESFPLRTEPLLAPVLSAPAPGPWVRREVLGLGGGRRLEVRYVDAEGRGAGLCFSPPAAVLEDDPDPLLRTPRFTMGVLADAGLERPAAELATWARELLRGSVGSEDGAQSGQHGEPEAGGRADIKIGFACNNLCSFCVQGDKREHHPARPMARIRADLEGERGRGSTGVVITGGEPTLSEHVLEVVGLARELGFTSIQLQSNGRRFAYRSFCRQAVEAGATEFSPALHGSTPEIHDRLTNVEGSFRQTVAGIRNLKRLGQRVITNSVVTTVNCRDLPRLAALLVKLGVDQFQLAFVHIVGTAASNRDWLVPRKSDAMPFVRRALDVGRRAGVGCMTEAIPYCLMTGYESCVAEAIIPPTSVFDADMHIEDYTQYRRTEGKAKGPDCARCIYDDRCEGPWREYPELFGWREFRPVKRPPDGGPP